MKIRILLNMLLLITSNLLVTTTVPVIAQDDKSNNELSKRFFEIGHCVPGGQKISLVVYF